MAEGNAHPYKYSCRKCPIRNRCIDYSDNSPTIKAQIRNAFVNKTDTIDLWAHLQAHCLLIKADEEARKGTTESLLSKRLRRAHKAQKEALAGAKTAQTPSDSAATPAPSPPRKPTFVAPVHTLPPAPPNDIRAPHQLTRREIISARSSGRRYWITIPTSGRHIALPVDGAVVLGRYDPTFGIPPDVDLTFEDREHASISRRHARISGTGGIHFIEEMGSRAGIIINGQKLSLGTTRRLYEGDTLILGQVTLGYGIVPGWVQRLAQYPNLQHRLMVASTGDVRTLKPGVAQVIGRSDRFVNFTADIDLSKLGSIAKKVSRRHAMLSYQPASSQWLIEDMGSGFGTKINGELMMPGQIHTLVPGDHIWLGGCVLVYDVEAH